MGVGERMRWDGMGKGDKNRDGERMEWKGDGNREKDGMGKGMGKGLGIGEGLRVTHRN